MNPLGFHYLIELKDCDQKILKDVKFLEKLLRSSVVESGATEIGHIFHKFAPHGVSGVVLISESHFSIHTWPEKKYAAVDLFTCNNKVDISYIYGKLKKELNSKSSTITEIHRGLLE
jgi:S-adenosylmethionine decarboxylase